MIDFIRLTVEAPVYTFLHPPPPSHSLFDFVSYIYRKGRTFTNNNMNTKLNALDIILWTTCPVLASKTKNSASVLSVIDKKDGAIRVLNNATKSVYEVSIKYSVTHEPYLQISHQNFSHKFYLSIAAAQNIDLSILK